MAAFSCKINHPFLPLVISDGEQSGAATCRRHLGADRRTDRQTDGDIEGQTGLVCIVFGGWQSVLPNTQVSLGTVHRCPSGPFVLGRGD